MAKIEEVKKFYTTSLERKQNLLNRLLEKKKEVDLQINEEINRHILDAEIIQIKEFLEELNELEAN